MGPIATSSKGLGRNILVETNREVWKTADEKNIFTTHFLKFTITWQYLTQIIPISSVRIKSLLLIHFSLPKLFTIYLHHLVHI